MIGWSTVDDSTTVIELIRVLVYGYLIFFMFGVSFEEEEVKADKQSLSMELPHEIVKIILKLPIERLNNVSIIVGQPSWSKQD